MSTTNVSEIKKSVLHNDITFILNVLSEKKIIFV